MHIDERIDNGIDWLKDNGIRNWPEIILNAGDKFDIESSCNCVVGLTLGTFDFFVEDQHQEVLREDIDKADTGYSYGFVPYAIGSDYGSELVDTNHPYWNGYPVDYIDAFALEEAWVYRAKMALAERNQ